MSFVKRFKNKLKENTQTLKLFGTIAGILTMSTWFCTSLVTAFFVLDAQIAVLTGLVWLTYGAIPILFSSFVLTLLVKYGIIFQFNQNEELFDYLAHGDEKHRNWLNKAIICFYKGEERPEEE